MSVSYYDPEAEPMPEPDIEPEPPKPAPKKRGRPKGSTNKKKKKKKFPWFTAWRVVFWGTISTITVVSTYLGVQSLLGQGAAYLALAVTSFVAAYLLDRDWEKVRSKK